MKSSTLTKLFAALAVLPLLTSAHPAPSKWDSRQATPALVSFLERYFKVKSNHDGPGWVKFFNPAQIDYCDAVLGECFTPYSTLAPEFIRLAATWPANGTSQYLYAYGDMNSAVLHFVDTPSLFGAEIRSMTALDFKDGLIIRQIDYWDGRLSAAAGARAPRDQYPYDLGISTVSETAAPAMQQLATKLNSALAAGDADAAGAMFAYNAVFEDFTLRVRQEGQEAISRYLQRALSQLPYGPGATLRHVMGISSAGGYEWAHNGTDVINGIVMLEQDRSGLITSLKTTWDASFVSNATMRALAVLALEN